MKFKKYYYIKVILEKVVCLFLLLIFLPFFIIIALLIKLTSKGKVLFKQERIGQNGKVFNIYKFRTMIEGAEKTGSKNYSFDGDPRVTRIGKILRNTSIDELPQLLNIIKGEMSIIGPRPVLTYFPWKFEEYTNEQLQRFILKPGVTGLAQINGRKQVEWEKRIKFDIEYVKHYSFALDIKIIIKTITQVLKMENNINTIETVSNKKKDVSNNNV